ncbi:multicopper oxidase family protein [Haladaptatus sp. DYSN1]|uniref:multicopper oxidase family protein n=1 Tax=unclassified Haladaptatus TaxID=2622732 RepID=UPI0024050FB4|nr:multicopper oxidase domain-containing protein [Haladaptatus sp. DYSN1]
MREVTRRRVLQAGTALGLSGTILNSIAPARAQPSPNLEKFVEPVPIPSAKAPDGKRNGADYHHIKLEEFDHSFHPDLADTTLWGFDGQFPGPLIEGNTHERLAVEFDNSALPDDHLLSVDERVNGTNPDDYPDYDGPVPEVRTVTHFHGLNIEPESDGKAEAWTSPDGVEGPLFAQSVHEIPNRQSRMTSTYHDHALGITRLNNYAGLVGFYFIRSEQEEKMNLPSDEYEIPLLFQDKAFEEDGALHYPESFEPNVSGDTAVVNGTAWPYLEVEPRRYRFRLVNQSNGRTFNMRLSNDDGTGAPQVHQFAPDQGFLESVVSIGPEGDLDSLTLAPFERADVIVDFSEFAGETFTLTNDAEFPYEGENAGSNLPELLQVRVTDPAEKPEDDSAEPAELDLPGGTTFREQAAKETRHMTLNMNMTGELDTHLLNNAHWNDEDAVVYPQLGSTEIWEFENMTHHTHPIHMHLVGFEVIGRGPDGTAEPLPNERGDKDVVRVNPDETVRIITTFENFAGRYPWHCHILEHEDQEMMLPFEVTKGNERR